MPAADSQGKKILLEHVSALGWFGAVFGHLAPLAGEA